MSPTTVYLVLVVVAIAAIAFGATLLNVPPGWTAAGVVLAFVGALVLASRPSKVGRR